MSATVALRRAQPERRLSLFGDAPSREPTLAEVLAGVWEGLSANGRATCPICRAAMEAGHGAAEGGRCATCGSKLS